MNPQIGKFPILFPDMDWRLGFSGHRCKLENLLDNSEDITTLSLNEREFFLHELKSSLGTHISQVCGRFAVRTVWLLLLQTCKESPPHMARFMGEYIAVINLILQLCKFDIRTDPDFLPILSFTDFSQYLWIPTNVQSN